ncbi:hypothetical protein JCM19233_4391 [Vibrio astriarenae]|nr:hypothetical protein JCM19233_4391 [Vibrio sp. C7]
MSGSSTKKLSKFSPNGLLMLFVVAITLVFGGTSMLVVSSQTRQSIEQLQDGNGAFELESARIFIEQYLEVAEDRIVLASQNPLLADALAEKDKANLTYLLDRYRGSNQPILFAARDIDGHIQYEDTFRHPASEQEAVIFEAMANATTDERIVYLLHDDTSHICLKLFMPVKREGQFVGMLYGEVPVDYDEFLEALSTAESAGTNLVKIRSETLLRPRIWKIIIINMSNTMRLIKAWALGIRRV